MTPDSIHCEESFYQVPYCTVQFHSLESIPQLRVIVNSRLRTLQFHFSEFYSGFPTQQIPLCNVLLFVIVFSAPWNQAAAAAAVSSERVHLLGFEWFRGFCACHRPHRPSSCRPPFVPFPSLLVAVSSSRLVKKKHCRFLRRVHFSCAVF